MILLLIIRRAHCEMCQGEFDLDPEAKPPIRCRLCHSPYWLYGRPSRESRMIRQGIKRLAKPLERPPSKSLKNQERGLRQWRRFRDKEGNLV